MYFGKNGPAVPWFFGFTKQIFLLAHFQAMATVTARAIMSYFTRMWMQFNCFIAFLWVLREWLLCQLTMTKTTKIIKLMCRYCWIHPGDPHFPPSPSISRVLSSLFPALCPYQQFPILARVAPCYHKTSFPVSTTPISAISRENFLH